MLAHRLEADFDDPYDEVSSAKSLNSSFHSGDKSLTSSHSGDSNSRDNLLQLIEAGWSISPFIGIAEEQWEYQMTLVT